MTLVLNKNLTEPKIGLWNRLEPRPTKHDFSKVLSAETYDALWMLNRQWQFGEFKGEDTGSAVFSQIRLRNTKLSRYAPGNEGFTSATIEAYNDKIPLEAKVEAEQMVFDLKTHLQISVYWKRLLNKAFGSDPGLYEDLLTAFKNVYSIAPLNFATIEEEANHSVHKKAVAVRQIASSKWLLDGERLYQDFLTQIQSNQLIENLFAPGSFNLGVESAQFNQIANDFVQWFKNLWVQPQGNSSWKANRLEYQFANTVPKPLPFLPQQTLLAKEYYHGKLDWYVYDIDATNTILNNPALIPNENIQSSTFTRTMLPAPVRFQGMPVPRWWELEEGTIDFGKIYSNTNDIAHILLAQFGLIYSNDWQIIPFKIPIGSLSEIEKLMVTDVFGQKTIVRSANQQLPATNTTVSSNWNYWAMFNLSHKENPNNIPPDGKLLFPPAIHKVMESKPVEEILFARDEVSNIVWAIEKTIMGPLGHGVDWDNLSKDKKQFILDKIGIGLPSAPPLEPANYHYQYITDTTPENWIPFVPRKRVSENNIMILQRGIIERNFPAIPSDIKKIRPAGKILNENTNGNLNASVYFLNNEEVPKEGIIVTRSFQRTRWLNGKVINWLGRRKTAALGQIHNQLEFDVTTNFNKTKVE